MKLRVIPAQRDKMWDFVKNKNALQLHLTVDMSVNVVSGVAKNTRTNFFKLTCFSIQPVDPTSGLRSIFFPVWLLAKFNVSLDIFDNIAHVTLNFTTHSLCYLIKFQISNSIWFYSTKSQHTVASRRFCEKDHNCPCLFFFTAVTHFWLFLFRFWLGTHACSFPAALWHTLSTLGSGFTKSQRERELNN